MPNWLISIIIGVIVKLVEHYIERITPQQKARILAKIQNPAPADPTADEKFRDASMP
jgi:hypothetical protein